MDDIKYMEKFIIEAGKVSFATADGRRWRMRQPTPEEAANGDSAYRLAYRRVMEDGRLMELAGSKEDLEREARIRASAAEAVYLLPLLLEKEAGQVAGPQGHKEEIWLPAFNVFDPALMAEFEALDGAIVAEMTQVYWGPVQEAVRQAKKKFPAAS